MPVSFHSTMDADDPTSIEDPLSSGAVAVICQYSSGQTQEECSFKTPSKIVTIHDMPEEILEHILGYLSPYRDLDAAKLVSKQWNRIVKSTVKQLKRRFYQNLSRCDVNWTYIEAESHTGHSERMIRGINDRFSHSAVYYDGSMYVFGGCTSTNTTFNDLWRFDLTTRKWVRPIAVGTYPSPKACATMVEYNGNLVLFGGWSHPIPYPLHQSAHYFSELHVYSTITNRWSHVLSLSQEPEALGGHSASVAGHLMVVFGGSPRPGMGTNNLWVFNFLKASWTLQPITHDTRPEPRYGQFQTTLDERHILIMGGCVGQNRVYSDLWLLTLHPADPWQWTKLTVEHPELAAPQTWCHAACRVKDSIVVVARSSKVRLTRNIRAQKSRRSSSGNSSTDSPQVSPESMQVQQCSSHDEQSHQSSQDVQQQHPHEGVHQEAAGVEAEETLLPNAGLLALQQRLHRECVNLPDPDDHHHRPQKVGEDETEGHFQRIENRWGTEQGQGADRSQHYHRAPQQNVDQPQFGSFQRLNSPASSGRARASGMPSIRPNAMNNRQKQLEALQRQEDLLRSKFRAQAAARIQKPADNSDDTSQEEHAPDLVPSRNKMDVHILDISRVLSEGVGEWKPLSNLQPTDAPTEAICCSLLEGRGELMLFGGVVRNPLRPVMPNTAVNKLYILQAQ